MKSPRFGDIFEALGGAAEALRAVMDATRDGIVFQEPLGRVVAANTRAEELLGLSGERLLGATSFSGDPYCLRADGTPFPGEDHPSMVALRTGEPSDGTVMGVRHADDTVRWFEISSRPLQSPDVPVPCGVVSVLREIPAPA